MFIFIFFIVDIIVFFINIIIGIFIFFIYVVLIFLFNLDVFISINYYFYKVKDFLNIY